MKIVSVKKITSSSKRYDLTTKNSCFFANNILVHNSSTTFVSKDNDLHVCSRNLSLKDDGKNVYWRMAHKYNIPEKLQGRNLCIQGELVGEGVQANPIGLKGHHFYVFNAIDLNDGFRFLNFEELKMLCEELQLDMVPVEYVGPFTFSFDTLKEMSNGTYAIGPGKMKEGIVIRTVDGSRSRILGGARISFKVVSAKYLLKHKE